MPDVLLFDLDGTLVDTAPTLIGIVNTMLAECALPLMPFAQARNLVSRGARPVLQRGFGERLHAEQESELLARFLTLYRQNKHSDSRIFIDLPKLLKISSKNTRYGIVTNKPTDLTQMLLQHLHLPLAPACIVCGDTLASKKPDPAPLLHAAELLSADPGECIYIGDDQRDVEAGRAARMCTVVAAWGYIAPETRYERWGADSVATHPRRLERALAEIGRKSLDEGDGNE